MLGLHLTLRATGCTRRVRPATLLGALVERLGLHAVAPPLTTEQAGVVLLASSHASVHYDGDLAWLDLFSCQPFDPEAAAGLVQELLAPATLDRELIRR